MVLIAIGQVFCRMFLSLGVLNVFLLFKLNYGFGGRMPEWGSAFVAHTREYILSTWFVTGEVNLDHVAQQADFKTLVKT